MLATVKEFLMRLWRSVHYGCAPLIDATLRLYAALAAGHEKVYVRLVKQHVVVRLTLLVFLTLLHLALIIPCVAWLIAGISGGFLWTSTLTLWDLAWIIWASYNDVLCDCGRFASCSTDNSLAYIQAYFTALGQYPDSRTFHILFGIYVLLTAMYQAGLTMSLLMGTPVYRPVRSIAFAYGLMSYVFALWYLGLNGGIDPDTPCGFMILWWFGATLGYCLAWLAKH